MTEIRRNCSSIILIEFSYINCEFSVSILIAKKKKSEKVGTPYGCDGDDEDPNRKWVRMLPSARPFPTL